MNTADTTQTAVLFKALGDSNRLGILLALTDGELCACKLLERFSITQPTLSHHMKLLREAGFVNERREGKWSHYSLNAARFDELSGFLTQFCQKGD